MIESKFLIFAGNYLSLYFKAFCLEEEFASAHGNSSFCHGRFSPQEDRLTPALFSYPDFNYYY